MTDYAALIDEATWAFIRATEAAYPVDTASLSIAEQRALYDRMCRTFFQGYPAGVTATDHAIAGVACRSYPGTGPSLIYLHGGGFVVGGLNSHDDVCAEIRAATGLAVVSVDYRLSPEHRHPAAFDDTLAVTRHLAAQGPVLLAGDSAGANLAAATAHALRAEGIRPLGQILIYPGLGGDMDKGSYITHAEAPMLTRNDIFFYRDIRLGALPPEGDPTFAPLQDTNFADLPPTVTFGAECDPLCDDAAEYASALIRAAGRARFFLEPGLVHGYMRARATVPRAAASFARITTAIAALARGEWPYGDLT